jgi:predicted permease
MLKDLAVAWRTLLKKPSYAIAVTATLGLGIGASAMTFSLLDAALLRPLPFERPDRLVALVGVAGPERSPRGASFPEILDWRARASTLDDVVIFDDASVNLRVGNASIRAEAELVSARYFPLLGVRPALGRAFLPEEDAVPDRDAVAVVSHAFWRERLGGDPQAVSSTIVLNERPLRVVGVMPEGFRGLSFDTEVWVPSMLVALVNGPGMATSRNTRWLVAYARLKEGVTRDRAQEDLTRVAQQLEAEFPATNRQRGVDVRVLRDSLLGGGRGLVVALFGAVALLLLVACTNVASLQLARATARRRELAVRIALGAGRWHIVRQLLAESIVLSAAAGAVGTLAAAWALGTAVTLMPEGALPAYVQPAVEVRAVLFAFVASAVVAIVVPLLPALASSRQQPSDSLKAGARTVEPGLGSIRRPSMQQLLVVGEIALATVLLASAALMARSLQRQMDVRLGFDPTGVTVARLSLPLDRYPPAARAEFVTRLREHLAEMPDVAAVAVGSDTPLTGRSSASLIVPDSAQPADPAVRYYRHLVAPGYFAALGIAITRGREFTDADRQGSPPVAVISESGARRLWGGADPVGRYLLTNDSARRRIEIVGVAADARFRDLRTDMTAARAEPDVFFPYGQRTDGDLELAVRTRSGAPVSAAAMQAVVGRMDPGIPVFQTQPLSRAVARQTSSARFISALMAAFSVAALLLAALGLYGLLAYVIGLSRREIAIRLALGANARAVVGLIAGNGLVLVLTGAALGGLGAAAAGHAMASLLFRTSPVDPAALASVALLLIVVAAAAMFGPARRALRIEPHAALKD